MGKGWRVTFTILIIFLMFLAILGSNNVLISNPEKGTLMYNIKNVDIYLEKIIKFIGNYAKNNLM